MELTEKEQKAREMLCLPLDDIETIAQLSLKLSNLSPVVGMFKIGKGTFTRFGPDSIKIVQEYNSKVFLDLKYHDIPNTVKDVARAASELGVYMFNVHASGGLEMMKAAYIGAKEGAEKFGQNMPKVIGVTVLTSIDDNILNNELKISGTVNDRVLDLALLTYQAGLDGIVCAASDLSYIKSKIPIDRPFIYVTPGIQGINTKAGADQKRVYSPGEAVRDGSSVLVVGRAITAQKTTEERIQAGYEILQDMAKYL